MRVLIVDKFGAVDLKDNQDAVPRVGDAVYLNYTPFPKVQSVTWYPERKMIHSLYPTITGSDVDVIVFVG